MENVYSDYKQLPFKCRAACVSLIGGSLILSFIFFIYYLGYISIETTIGVSMGVFIILAIYESYLLSSLTRHMMKDMNKNQGGSKTL
jgi:hypothetical protein